MSSGLLRNRDLHFFTEDLVLAEERTSKKDRQRIMEGAHIAYCYHSVPFSFQCGEFWLRARGKLSLKRTN